MADVARLNTRSLVDLMKQKNAEDSAGAPTLGAGIRDVMSYQGLADPNASLPKLDMNYRGAFLPADTPKAAPSTSTFSGVPGSFEAVTDFRQGVMPTATSSFESVSGGIKPSAQVAPEVPSSPPQSAPAPVARGVGSYIKTLDNGKVYDASGQATGGFGVPEASRLKNVAINDARQAEMTAALDRGRLVEANNVVDFWNAEIGRASTPFELQKAQAGLAGAQSQLTTLSGTRNAEVTGGFGLKGHEIVAQTAKEAQTESARIAGEAKVEAAEATNSTEKAKLAADAKIKAAEIAANAPAVKEQAAADALLAGQLGIGLDQVKGLREAGGTFKKRSGFPGFRKPAGFYDAQGNLMDPATIGVPKTATGPGGAKLILQNGKWVPAA